MINNSPKDTIDQIMQNDKGVIKKIDVVEREGLIDLVIFFESGKEQHTCLNDMKYPYHLTSDSIEILKSIVSTQQAVLIKCASGYYDSGRTYLIFLYDLVTLCWFLDKLGTDFKPLEKMDNGDRELLHNRIVSQIAVQLDEKYNDLEFEKKLYGRRPDLFANNTHIEIKTINTPVLDTKDYETFYDNFERQFNKAKEQTSNKGVIIMGFWSKRINNELKEYFSGLINDDLEDIDKNKTVIILDGDAPLRDRYLVIPTSSVLDLIGDYCKGGYKKVDPMAYVKTMMRKGFPYNIVGTEPSHISFVYKMG